MGRVPIQAMEGVAHLEGGAAVRILVTGGAGFIGSHFVRLVEELGHEVTILDNLSAGSLDNLRGTKATLIQGDVADRDVYRRVEPGMDAVVHLAAETHVDRSIGNPIPFVHTNVCGTGEVLEYVRRSGIARMLHVSTDEVYGSIEEGSWNEDSPLMPRSPYSASKAASDLLALSYVTTYSLNVSVTRCSNNYGSYQLPEKLIPHFIQVLQEGGDVPVYGEGMNVRDWLHVSDHCMGLWLALTRGRAGRVYNIGGGLELTNLAMTRALLSALGAGEERITFVADRPGHDQRYSLDWGRAHAELGYAPQVAFETGIKETIAWYTSNPEWVSRAQIRATTLFRTDT